MKPISLCKKCGGGLSLWVKNKEAKFGGYWRCRTCHVASTRRYRNLSVSARLLASCKARAKREGVLFNLTLEDVGVPSSCPIFHIPLIPDYTKRTDNTPSVDRIVPSKGYVKGNITVISWKANRIKSNATLTELSQLHHYYAQLVTSKESV